MGYFIYAILISYWSLPHGYSLFRSDTLTAAIFLSVCEKDIYFFSVEVYKVTYFYAFYAILLENCV